MSEFVDCRDPGSTCEYAGSLLGGVAGVCNLSSGLCECPPGYHGRDSLARWNDCHVNENVRIGIETFASALVGTSMVVSFAAIVRLLWLWGVISLKHSSSPLAEDYDDYDLGGGGDGEDLAGVRQHAQISPTSSTSPQIGSNGVTTNGQPLSGSTSPGGAVSSPFSSGMGGLTISTAPLNDSSISPAPRKKSILGSPPTPQIRLEALRPPRTNVPNQQHQAKVAEHKRRRTIFWLLGNFCVFSIYGFIVQTLILVDPWNYSFEQTPALLLFCLAGAITTNLWGLWLFTWGFFSTLPSLRMFGKLFPDVQNSYLVRYPNLVLVVAVSQSAIHCTLSYLFIFILPLANPVNTVQYWIPVGIGLMALTICIYLFVMIPTELLLLRLLNLFTEDKHNHLGRGTPDERRVSGVSGLSRGTSEGRLTFTRVICYCCWSGARGLGAFTTNAPASGATKARPKFESARRTVTALYYLTMFAAPLSLCLIMVIALHPVVRAHYFIFLSMLNCIGAGIALVASFIFSFRISTTSTSTASPQLTKKKSSRPGSGASGPPLKRSDLGETRQKKSGGGDV